MQLFFCRYNGSVMQYFIAVLCYSLLITNTSCVNTFKKKDIGGNETTLLISKHIENGSLSYNDVFESNYLEFSDRNEQNQDVLDGLVEKLKFYTQNNNDNGTKKIDVDEILDKNIDKIVDKILEPKNLKYNIYGSDCKRWFLADESMKAPLNYFQQQFLLQASTEMLKKITCAALSKITSGDKIYQTNYGSLWVLYGKSNKLEEGFEILKSRIDEIDNKFVSKRQKLSKTDLNTLKTIIDMKKFNDIKTDSFGEYVSKSVLLSKSKPIVKRAERILLLNK